MEAAKPKYTTEEQDLIQKAQSYFSKKNFTESLNCLNALDTSNVKISLDKSVVQYYNSGLVKTEAFQRALQKLMFENREMADEACEEEDLTDMGFVYYNYAVVSFHNRQPFRALQALRVILKITDKFDDFLFSRIYLLCITLLIDIHQTNVAAAAIATIESRLGAPKDPPPLMLNDEFGDEVTPDRTKNLLDFKRMLRYTITRLQILLNSDKVIDLLSSTDDTSDYGFLRAYHYYVKKDYKTAAHELSKPFSNEPYTIGVNGECQDTALANNMGLIHFSVRNYALAVRFFQQALTFDGQQPEEMDYKRTLYSYPAGRRSDILYNLGVALLHLERAQDAFECFLVPLKNHHNNPRLWLRLAECCIMVHRQSEKQKTKIDLRSKVIGSGMLRMFVLMPASVKYKSETPDSYAIPNPNLEFASLCLRNGLTLVYDREADAKADGGDEVKDRRSVPAMPSKPLDRRAFNQVKGTLLANLSYVFLCLGEFTLALKNARELLEQPELSDPHKMLANLYCAESLVMLDRANQAQPYLNPSFLSQLDQQSFECKGGPGWDVPNVEVASAIVSYNLALSLIMSGNYEMAAKSLSNCNCPQVFPYAKKLKLYLELQVGNYDLARLTLNSSYNKLQGV